MQIDARPDTSNSKLNSRRPAVNRFVDQRRSTNAECIFPARQLVPPMPHPTIDRVEEILAEAVEDGRFFEIHRVSCMRKHCKPGIGQRPFEKQ